MACLSDPREPGLRIGAGRDRLAMADDGSVCRVAHEKAAVNHPQNPLCPLVTRGGGRTVDRPSPARPRRRTGRAVRRPGGPAVQPVRAASLLGARGHGGDRRPDVPPPRRRGAVDDPCRAGPDRPGAARQPRPGARRHPPPAAAARVARQGRGQPHADRRALRRWRRSRTRRTPTSARPFSGCARRSARTPGWRARSASTSTSTAASPDPGQSRLRRPTRAGSSARAPRSSCCASSRRRSPTRASTPARPGSR